MDGLRKVPDNVPQPGLLAAYLGHPLSRIPDPFGTHESFAHHNNAMLCRFLDTFGFDYEFASATQYYKSGRFDAMLLRAAERYDKIMAVMLPTLRAERQATYSPVLPVSPASGRVLQVPVTVLDPASGRVCFTDEDGTLVEQSVFGGRAKLQWKVDWAMRWYALGVDYEMCGKDLTDSVTQSGRILRALGGRMPENMIYELFLDENGEKISKSKGNGLTIDEWLTYGTEESLGLYLYREPKSAKSLHIGVIPRAVDDYWQFRAKLAEQPVEQQLGNPAWHLLRANGYEGGDGDTLPVSYGLLLNLAGVLGAEATAETLTEYLERSLGKAADSPALERMIAAAVAYNRDFVAPTLKRRAPEPHEAAALRALDAYLAGAPADTSAEELQTEVYEIGKREAFGFESLRDWFKALYETLLGSSQGPRMGSFIALYGVANTRRLIAEALALSPAGGSAPRGTSG
jgi:lysyl-tRNA synthetase class 1